MNCGDFSSRAVDSRLPRLLGFGLVLLAAGCITPGYGPPPGAYPPGIYPPGTVVPGTAPTVVAPGTIAPGTLPPGTLPPGAPQAGTLAPEAINLPPGAVVEQPGAAPVLAPAGPQSTPVLIPNNDRDLVWDQVVDAVDDYFKVKQERRVKLEGDLLVEGNLETHPRGGSTILEPWNRDSTPGYERLESTLQSIRRIAFVRVAPAEQGFWVEVAVMKELEDVARPESGTISVTNLRNDSSTSRFVDPLTGARPTVGWIPLGHDVSLEQTILANIQSRFGGQGFRPY